MVRYRNRGTGRLVESARRDPYLDSLPQQWERLDPPEGDEPRPAPTGPPERPAKRASRAVWAAYAVACGADEGEVAGMTRTDLVVRYGGD